MKRLNKKRLSVVVLYWCSLLAGDDERVAIVIYNVLQEKDGIEVQGSDSLSYEDFDAEPNRLCQGLSTAVSWLVGIVAVPIGFLTCCRYNPGKIVDLCNPLHERYVSPFRAESDSLCDQANYICCPCVYKKQRSVYEDPMS